MQCSYYKCPQQTHSGCWRRLRTTTGMAAATTIQRPITTAPPKPQLRFDGHAAFDAHVNTTVGLSYCRSQPNHTKTTHDTATALCAATRVAVEFFTPLCKGGQTACATSNAQAALVQLKNRSCTQRLRHATTIGPTKCTVQAGLWGATCPRQDSRQSLTLHQGHTMCRHCCHSCVS